MYRIPGEKASGGKKYRSPKLISLWRCRLYDILYHHIVHRFDKAIDPKGNRCIVCSESAAWHNKTLTGYGLDIPRFGTQWKDPMS